MKAVGLLRGYRLEFAFMSRRWKGAAANIYPDPHSHVYGVLWQLNLEDQESLDEQEGVSSGIYERVSVTAEVEGKPVECLAYKVTKSSRENSISTHGDSLLPSTVYKNVIIRGAKEHNLPSEYINFLENIPDNGYEGEVEVNLPLHQQ
jgi:gamma-glutamylcyclotransferase